MLGETAETGTQPDSAPHEPLKTAGSSPVQGVLGYAEPPPGAGLYVMDTPGHDSESVTGMVAGGAQVVLFSTGRGTPLGAPVARTSRRPPM